MPRRVWVVALGFWIVAAGTARAEDVRAQARRHFEAGEALYRAGEYRGAIGEFRAADELVPSPILSFNVGLCHEKLGETRDAIRLYRDYLARRPDAPNRAQVEQRIAQLEARPRAPAAPSQEPPGSPRAAPPAQATPPGPADSPAPGSGSPASGPGAAEPGTPGGRDATPPPARRPYDEPLARRIPDRAAPPAPAAPDDSPAAQPAPGPAPAPVSPPRPQTRTSRPVYKQWWFWVVVGVSALIVIDVASGDGGSESTATGVVVGRF